MVGFDDAAMMALGAINAGVQIAGNQRVKKLQKKLDKMQKAATRRQFQRAAEDVYEERRDASRELNDAEAMLKDQLQERGLTESSIATDEEADMAYDRERRMRALTRRAEDIEYDRGLTESGWRINKKIKKTQDTMNMISMALMQGGGGVAQGMGASLG